MGVVPGVVQELPNVVPELPDVVPGVVLELPDVEPEQPAVVSVTTSMEACSALAPLRARTRATVTLIPSRLSRRTAATKTKKLPRIIRLPILDVAF